MAGPTRHPRRFSGRWCPRTQITSGSTYGEIIGDIVTELGTWTTCATNGAQKTAEETYYAGCSVCTERARLCAAMLRTKNIPARTISKYQIMPTHHTWTQAYITGYGWLDVDAYFGVCPKTYAEIILVVDDSEDDAGAELISRPPTHFLLFTTNQMNEWLSGPDNDGDLVPDALDPDDDNDGMPDLWEAEYGLSTTNFNGGAMHDADGDHACDVDEFVAGTNPTNAASCFRIESVSVSPERTLSFLTATDRVYGVECCPGLHPAGWQVLTSNIVGTGGTIEVPISTNTFQQFYRLNVCLP